MIKIIIADDQVLLRKSLGQIISTDEEIIVADMVGSGKEAIASCEKNKPDIVLMDIEMPQMDGISALKIIKEKYPEIKVIILTTFDNAENIVESFLSEADGYIVKDIDCEELITTIKCVNYGLTVVHKSVKKIMVNKFKKMSNSKKTYTDLLSLEEIDMIRLIVAGKSNKEIGKAFGYTEGTVKNKVSRIYEKLKIKDRLQLAVYAVENGIE
ncbi:response regulator [Crassaminicella profunda]|uniref:response regulator n=1 Tax=Crassaminicella profunda TaxID=1286698 RepID=UPI001CA608FE|nr:response regulator transcription factor [Crassaminicella profunda]QZY53711.1 response regulator transcription factor [Crassaminicella profunda]